MWRTLRVAMNRLIIGEAMAGEAELSSRLVLIFLERPAMWWITQSQWNALNRKVDALAVQLARIEDKENLILKLCTDSRLSSADQAKLNRIFEITEADAAKIDAAVGKK